MKVIIASPAAGGTVTTGYAGSLMSAAAALHGVGATFVHEIVDGPDIVANRNYLANTFLRNDELSHIPIVILTTSLSDHTQRGTAFARGAAGCITKPSSYSALLAVTQSLNTYWFTTNSDIGP